MVKRWPERQPAFWKLAFDFSKPWQLHLELAPMARPAVRFSAG
jgi:hypothetical protein